LPDCATYRLLPHPALPNAGSRAIEVAVNHSATGLALSYRIAGPIDAIQLPAPTAAGPADELWRHTCCEAFIAGANGTYHEFNFSPAGTWAVYRFTDVRQRDPAYRPPVVPLIHSMADADGLTLTADIPAALLPTGAERRLGLSAVIEHADGSLAYWALRHDGPQPDFHRPATFLISLDSA
jgi:hypothetical protein